MHHKTIGFSPTAVIYNIIAKNFPLSRQYYSFKSQMLFEHAVAYVYYLAVNMSKQE